jgi:ribonuclease HII
MMQKYSIGIDEAGRGPLAGPVAVGAVKFSKDFDTKLLKEIKNKDSKKLSQDQRAIWYEKIKIWKQENKLDFYVALVSSEFIDKKGISFAIKKGITECLKKIKANSKTCEIKLDGSLKAPEEFIFQKTIIKGDEKEQIIGLASIAAKVTRDIHMGKLAIKFPAYKFEIHKGYGTAFHRAKIKELGLSVVHRKSFIH